jgi:NADH-quinone oxidoreductase subunit G
VLALGPIPTQGVDRTFKPDASRGRTGDTSFVVSRPFTIHAEKCPNRRGVELILEHFQKAVIPFEELVRRAGGGEFQGLYSVSASIDSWIDDQAAAALRSAVRFLVVQDTLATPLAQRADVVLAGATFAEKAGSYVNAGGRLQYAAAALPPRDGSLPDLDLLAILLHRPGGPVRSHEVLAELAQEVPAFGVAVGGRLPEYGALIGQPRPSSGLPDVPPFTDSWFVARGAARWR